MKKIVSLLVLVLFAFSVQAQEGQPAPVFKNADGKKGPIMQLESDVVDYGTIEQKAEPLRIVKFTNVGDEPLLITAARGSCGCTVPTWPKEAVAPGESSQIEIRYDTNRIGAFTKRVTVNTNESSNNEKVITVKGTVDKIEEPSAPPAEKGF